ncbi:MAG: DUF2062 domain-containing protein [Myxococcota bacterium]
MSLLERIRVLVARNLLQLDDTPHRIAFGVFWGFLIGATPTIGIQVVLYLAVASVVGANRISGILPIWLSNPVTAVPLYYSEWQIGRLLVTGSFGTAAESWGVISTAIQPAAGQSWWSRILELDLYVKLFDAMVSLGVELWVGSVLVGVAVGGIGYYFAYHAVKKYRQAS